MYINLALSVRYHKHVKKKKEDSGSTNYFLFDLSVLNHSSHLYNHCYTPNLSYPYLSEDLPNTHPLGHSRSCVLDCLSRLPLSNGCSSTILASMKEGAFFNTYYPHKSLSHVSILQSGVRSLYLN